MTRTLTAAETKAAHDAAESIRANAVDTFGHDFDDVEYVLNNRDEVLCAYEAPAGCDPYDADDDAIWAAVVARMSS